MASSAKPPARDIVEPTVIKSYAQHRLYNCKAGVYVSLAELESMLMAQLQFVVIDALSGQDLTASVLKQIIAERNP